MFGSQMRLCFALNVETATNAVAFLECFPKLIFAHIGGYAPNYDGLHLIDKDGTHIGLPYEKLFTTEPREHEAVFCGMLERFCEAFERQSLSGRLKLSGILSGSTRLQYQCRQRRPCRLCSRICQSFPLNDWVYEGSFLFCVDNKVFFHRIHQRDAAFFKNHSQEILLKFFKAWCEPADTEVRPIQTGQSIVSLPSKTITRLAPDDRHLNMVEFLCNELHCEPSKVCPDAFLRKLTRGMRDLDEKKPYWIARQDYDRLDRLGFPMTATDFKIIRTPIDGVGAGLWWPEDEFPERLL